MATLRISSEHDGAHLQAKIGDNIELRLPENPTTGYRWSIESPVDDLRVKADGYEGAQRPGIGAGNLRSLTLELRRAGPLVLHLLRYQAWQPKDLADAEFRCVIDVSQ